MCSLDFPFFLHCLWQKGFSTVISLKGHLMLKCSTHLSIDFLIECNHTPHQTQLSLWITVTSTSRKPSLIWSRRGKYLIFRYSYSNLWSIIGGCIMNFCHHIHQTSILLNLHSLPWSIACIEMANTSAWPWHIWLPMMLRSQDLKVRRARVGWFWRVSSAYWKL